MNAQASLLLILLSFGFVAPVNAADEEEASPATEQEGQEEEKKEEKPDTGGKFLPLPIIITEPAIGEGLGAALIYVHVNSDAEVPTVASGATLNRSDRKQTPPPTATASAQKSWSQQQISGRPKLTTASQGTSHKVRSLSISGSARRRQSTRSP